MHYYVVGVNGAGKTSVLQAISARTGINSIHGTAALMEYMGIPGDYQALRAMDQDKVLEQWAIVAKQIVADYGDKPLLLDTHIMNLTNGNIMRRDGEWIASYDALVLVKADPSTVLARVQKADKDRALFPPDISDSQKLNMLDAYQQQTESLFYSLSKHYNLPTLTIQNDGDLAAAADAFINSPL